MDYLRSKASAARNAVLNNVKSRFPGNRGGLSVTGTQISSTNTRNVHTIKIFKYRHSLFSASGNNFRVNDDSFTAFETALRTELTRKGWPREDTALNTAIKNYIDGYQNERFKPGTTTGDYFIQSDYEKTIIILAVLSGMITSIQFTNNMKSPIEYVKITNAEGYIKRYNVNFEKNKKNGASPYNNFKSELQNIAFNKDKVIVTITTDFSKVPPPPVKGGGTRVRRETRNRNRNHTRRIRTQRHRYRSVKLAKSRKSRR